MPPKLDAHEHTCPPAGSKEHVPPFSQGFGLHASAIITRQQGRTGRVGSTTHNISHRDPSDIEEVNIPTELRTQAAVDFLLAVVIRSCILQHVSVVFLSFQRAKKRL